MLAVVVDARLGMAQRLLRRGDGRRAARSRRRSGRSASAAVCSSARDHRGHRIADEAHAVGASGCSSWVTGRMPKGIGKSLPVSTRCTPGCAAALRDVDATRCARAGAASAAACSAACAAARCRRRSAVWPVTLARPSTRRRGLPMTFEARLRSVAHGRPPVMRRARLPRPPRRSAGSRCSGRGCRRAPPGFARGWGRAPVEQRLRGHQDARACSSRTARRRGRRTPPAAGAARRRVASPSTVSIARPSHSSAEHEARQHRLAVDQHGAGAALAELAAVLGAGEARGPRAAPRAASCRSANSTSCSSPFTRSASRTRFMPAPSPSSRRGPRRSRPAPARPRGGTSARSSSPRRASRA